MLSSISSLNTQEVINGGAVKLINAHNSIMKRVIQLFGVGSIVGFGANIGMLFTYLRDADLAESKLKDTPSFPV